MLKLSEFLFFEPIFMDRIWGGAKIGDTYGFKTASKQVGEYWAVSALSEASSIVREGAYQGMHLDVLYQKHPELFGYWKDEKFPLLIKVLDASKDLSVQVHPPDNYANQMENGQLGKTECWYILDSDNGSLTFGHNQPDRQSMEKMIGQNRWNDFLCTVKANPDDFFMVEPGKIHAIKHGVMLLEIQQSSDLTYRLYDYDRVDAQGNKRVLHLTKALDVIQFPDKSYNFEPEITKEGDATITLLCRSMHFTVGKVALEGTYHFINKEPFIIICVVGGEGCFNGYAVKNGDIFIIPATICELTVTGTVTYIYATVSRTM